MTRAQRLVARALAGGAHLQLCQGTDLDEDPDAFFVLVHTCDPSIDPDGFLYVERVQYRTLFALHMAGCLTEDANIVIGFGGDS